MVDVQVVSDEHALQRCFAVRTSVFVHEQNVPLEDEIDELDTNPFTVHVLATHDGADVGTARLISDASGSVRIGRVAVVSSARRLGVGRVLMRALEEIALEKYGQDGAGVRITLSAQERAMPFYAAIGYDVVDGRSYLDAGIPHQKMAKRVLHAT